MNGTGSFTLRGTPLYFSKSITNPSVFDIWLDESHTTLAGQGSLGAAGNLVITDTNGNMYATLGRDNRVSFPDGSFENYNFNQPPSVSPAPPTELSVPGGTGTDIAPVDREYSVPPERGVNIAPAPSLTPPTTFKAPDRKGVNVLQTPVKSLTPVPSPAPPTELSVPGGTGTDIMPEDKEYSAPPRGGVNVLQTPVKGLTPKRKKGGVRQTSKGVKI